MSDRRASNKKQTANTKASEERLRQRRSAKQLAILKAAGAELMATGYSGANLDRIAEGVFISKATLYHYFPTKQDLYRAWIDMVHSAAMERLEPLARSGEDPIGRLGAIITQHILLLTTEFPNYARLFLPGMDWPEDLRSVIHQHQQEYEALFRNVIDDGIETGAFSVLDETVARHCLQGCLAYIPEWYQPDGRLKPEEVSEIVVHLVLRLLGAETAELQYG